jgi:hypothetical protein
LSTKRNEYNDRKGGRRVIENRPDELEWLRDWEWKYWVTLTFSRDVGRDEGNALLDDFLNELEAAHHDSLTCMIGQERKTISGSGKPAGRNHFHLLIGSAVNLTASTIVNWWQLPEFGGSRTAGAGADARVYDPHRGAISYLLKFRQDPAWDVRYRNLELLSPDVPVSAATSSSMRRKLSRCKERRAGASVQPLRLSPLPWTHSNSEPVPFNGAAAEPRGCLVQHSVRGTLGVVDKSGVEVQVQYP